LYKDRVLKSYRHLVDEKVFVDSDGKNLAPKIFYDRFENAFLNIQHILREFDLLDCCTVNPDLLWGATLSYFEDIARLKLFHDHLFVQTDKIYAYEVFWYLRDHPIQIEKQDEIPYEYLYVNEYVFTYWLIRKIAAELASRFAPNIQIDDFIRKFEEHDLVKEFQIKIYYTFRYRPYTAQSLLLLIEAFMVAAEFTLQVT